MINLKPNLGKLLKIKKIEIIKWLGWVLFFSLLLLKCNKNNDLEIIENYNKEKEKFILKILEKEKIITELKKNNIELESINDLLKKNKNFVIKQKIKQNIEPIKNFTLKNQQEYFNKNYKQLSNSLKFVKLDSLQSFSVITDIEKGKIASYHVDELKKIIKNDSIQIGNYKVQLLEFEEIVDNQKGIIAICDYALKKTQKELKYRVLLGGCFGINKEINQSLFLLDLSIQGKKGNINRFSYLKIGDQEYALYGYNFNIYTRKKK